MPRGGFLLWSRLPAGVDSAELARRCLDEQVIMAPGNVFSVAQTAAGFVRMNVAQMTDPRVDAVLARALARCARTARGLASGAWDGRCVALSARSRPLAPARQGWRYGAPHAL